MPETKHNRKQPRRPDLPEDAGFDSVLSAFFLVGPTACGKSAVAEHIARKLGYEIISADSMQIYRGMDIGTAKPSQAVRSEIAYHGIDIVDPSDSFSAGRYLEYARKILSDSAERGRKIIVAGGTGLYIKALTDGLSVLPQADISRRAYWTDILNTRGIGPLQEALKEKSHELYKDIKDKQNGRRLVRALELAEMGIERRPTTWDKDRGASAPLPALALPPQELGHRIEIRVRDMYRLGLIDEVRSLITGPAPLSPTALGAIGYAEAIDVIEGRCPEKDAMARTVIRTRQLAKRQRTWFNHQANVRWIEIGLGMEVAEVAELVEGHWREYGPTRIA